MKAIAKPTTGRLPKKSRHSAEFAMLEQQAGIKSVQNRRETMNDQQRRDAGMAQRRKVLGDAWVDKSITNRNSFNAEFVASLGRSLDWSLVDVPAETQALDRDLEMYWRWKQRSASGSA